MVLWYYSRRTQWYHGTTPGNTVVLWYYSRRTQWYHGTMSAINIRLPAPVHQELRERAARTGMSINAMTLQALHLYLRTNPEKLTAWLASHPVPGDGPGTAAPPPDEPQ